VRDINELVRFMADNTMQGGQIFHTYYLNKDWYVLVFGSYNNHAEALKAMDTLPTEIKNLKPWIRQLSSVHKAINLYR
jgi:DamX protein